MDEPTSETPQEYAFSEPEARIIKPAMQEAQSKIDALNALVRLVVSQQNLAGNWGLKQDGSGLVRSA